MPNHFTLTFVFAAKGTIYRVAIATVIFSHVKISCFRAKAHLVRYFIGIYIIFIYLNHSTILILVDISKLNVVAVYEFMSPGEEIEQTYLKFGYTLHCIYTYSTVVS